jgi:bifunctional non-homologous end joining protein LigD
MSLREYQRKRNFNRTAEPQGDQPARTTGRRFVVQKHAARRLHYDFRLELDGVLKSWAVPKGPSLDPQVKSLAVQVEDHPLDYAGFEGIIPKGEYGGGTVMVWDHGEWEPEGNAKADLAKGRLKFALHGERLTGTWSLVRMKDRGDSDDGKNWLLIKSSDAAAEPGSEDRLTAEHSTSVVTGRSLDAIAADADSVWQSDRESNKSSGASGRKRSASSKQSKQAKPSKSSAPAAVDPSLLTGARKAKLPQTFAPHLATPANRIPDSDQWLHELKFDGYRLLAVVEGDTVRLLTRRGNDWTDRFGAVASSLKDLGLQSSLLDGELVALDADGVSDFQRLQNWMKTGRQEQLVYYVFDVPFFEGYDLQHSPLIERKQLLAAFLLSGNPGNDGTIRYSDHIRGQGPEVLQHSCRHALEGVISKRADSRYENRRSRSWLKSKCQGRQEFVIGGFTRPQGSRTDFGALLVGYREDSQWVYSGRVGTGFTQQSLEDLGRRLRKLKQDKPPFRNPPTGAQARGVTWTKPKLVAEIEFTEWTQDGVLRHPSFQGLREDKAPEEVVREDRLAAAAKNGEKALSSAPRKTAQGRPNVKQTSNSVAGVSLSNPERVLYPDQGVTKRELAEFYEAIADWILPHIVDRPLTLVRCPQGRASKCFYQKHWKETLPDAVDSILIREKEAKEPYVVIHDLSGLIALVQVSVLELHPWGSRIDRLERPDLMVFDLDPGEGVTWNDLQHAAVDVRDVLAEAGLESFVRTSGGKGLHVVVPITRRSSWDEVGQFCEQIAKGMAGRSPQQYVANMRKNLRKGRIFIDYLRNRRGATSIASYSTRARAGAPVATPLDWDELTETTSADQWTVRNLPERLEALSSFPWDGFESTRQSLTRHARQVADSLT